MKKDLLDKIRVVKTSHQNGINQKMILKQQDFSWRARFRSFGYAWNGIVEFFTSEPNAKLHLAATFMVAALSAFFGLTKTEACMIIFSIGFVWVTEMLNTAIEKIMDFISIEKHSKIRFIKDVAAGAVLVASITAALTGLIIFIPKFSAL